MKKKTKKRVRRQSRGKERKTRSEKTLKNFHYSFDLRPPSSFRKSSRPLPPKGKPAAAAGRRRPRRDLPLPLSTSFSPSLEPQRARERGTDRPGKAKGCLLLPRLRFPRRNPIGPSVSSSSASRRHHSRETPRPLLPHLGPRSITQDTIAREKGGLESLARDLKGGVFAIAALSNASRSRAPKRKTFLFLFLFPSCPSPPCCLPALSRSQRETERELAEREAGENREREREGWRQAGSERLGEPRDLAKTIPAPGPATSKRASPPIEAQNAHSSTPSSPPFVPSRIRSETASCVRAKLNFARRDQGRARVGIGGLFFRSLDGRFSGLDFFSPPAVTRQGKKLGPMPVPACLSSSRSSFSPQFSSTPLARAKPTVV